jgi:hypothetical protein
MIGFRQGPCDRRILAACPSPVSDAGPQVGSYLRYSGRAANVVGTAAMTQRGRIQSGAVAAGARPAHRVAHRGYRTRRWHRLGFRQETRARAVMGPEHRGATSTSSQ